MIHQIVESVKQEDYRRGDSGEVSLMNILQVLHVLQVLQVHTVSRRCQEQFGLLTADTVTVLRPAGDVLREATPAPRGARHCPAVRLLTVSLCWRILPFYIGTARDMELGRLNFC